MDRPPLVVLVCCWLAAGAIHIATPDVATPDVRQRIGELAARQDAALLYASLGSELAAVPAAYWGCDEKPFRMAMPAHTGTCTVTQAVVLTLKEAGINCTRNGKAHKNAGQDHDHHGIAQKVIGDVGWNKFNSSVSWVMAKDPWSRIVSATSWLNGFNASSKPDEQIRDFRKFVYAHLPANTTPSGIHVFNYLHSISEFAYAVPPGKSEEEQVVTYVGRVKDMSGSFKHICSLLGVGQESCVDPNDSRVRQHWVTHGGNVTRLSTVALFDDELRDRVAKIWAKDIERFGFVFGEL
ncbi:unnamed protein product [Prorocentrum cordatum]|uniref:Uncharacterized protein n=1 Tax=Prorocentrum cordatum TaxID=2364126 RepID=A0ABN9WFT4_9DINO|nr:unnamed protein product [Polarella glacialis]